MVAHGQLQGLLPERVVRYRQSAIAAKIERLAPDQKRGPPHSARHRPLRIAL
jgi:hypothetical protein